ncbi:MAG: hypothetical protein B6I26_04195 [Desulfobacteraceae bacterium 4572_130]|nr:MAG: hypothetical protein B6I26_04195 [Desulfobacteraceae bacterium 4572_130]
MSNFTMEDAKYCAEQVIHGIERTFFQVSNKDLSFFIRIEIFEESVLKAEQYLKVFKNPNLSKVAGYYSFWIRKLKPFYVRAKRNNNYITDLNEIFAILFGLVLISQGVKRSIPKLSKKFLNDLVYSLRYHTFSPQSVTLIFELILEKFFIEKHLKK